MKKALETKEIVVKQRYQAYEGFYVYIDHVLNVHRNFEKTYVTYEVVSFFDDKVPETSTSNKPLDRDVVRYKRSFAERHHIYGVEISDKTFLLIKFWVEEKFVKFDENEFDDLLNVEEEDPEFKYEHKYVVYGWAPFKLFYKEKLM